MLEGYVQLLTRIQDNMTQNFHSRTVHLNIIKGLLPTDTQENCFKRSIKIYIKTAQNVLV
jgi:hypothetical protein